jgi:hypothetical protein
MSIGPRATLPRLTEHGTAHGGVMPGDETSQAAGFTQCRHRQPATGLDSHRGRVVGAVTGLSHNASIGKSTRQATPSHRQRAESATRCAVRSEGVQSREPSAITRQQTPSGTDLVVGPVTHPY